MPGQSSRSGCLSTATATATAAQLPALIAGTPPPACCAAGTTGSNSTAATATCSPAAATGRQTELLEKSAHVVVMRPTMVCISPGIGCKHCFQYRMMKLLCFMEILEIPHTALLYQLQIPACSHAAKSGDASGKQTAICAWGPHAASHHMCISNNDSSLCVQNKCRAAGRPLGAFLPRLGVIRVDLHHKHCSTQQSRQPANSPSVQRPAQPTVAVLTDQDCSCMITQAAFEQHTRCWDQQHGTT
jgi:hypothetical protein